MEDAMESGIIKKAKELRLNEEEEYEYDRGLVFEKCPEILVKGHHAFSTKIVHKMKERLKLHFHANTIKFS